jgi:DNA adenine methylase
MSEVLYGYPGGKTRLRPYLLQALSKFSADEYREPFFGGGSVGLHMVREFSGSVWINDMDAGIVAIWQAVARFPKQLKELVGRFKASTGAFNRLKSFLLNNPVALTMAEMIFLGFAKLAVHKMSFSALGVKSSSRPQECIDKKWSPVSLCRKIDHFHDALTRKDVRITNGDYSDLISDVSVPAMLYLDPPYVDQGAQCYQHSFRYEDHLRLSELLKNTNHKWVMSYDDHELIHELYRGWTHIDTVPAPYSINGRVSKNELLISSE